VKVVDGAFSTRSLSTGQRKRLALVVAYLEDRPLYLFDEWAADQDPAFKAVFYEQLLPELRARGKTVIVVTHDDRYFSIADRVLKLENGMVVNETRGGGVRAATLDVQANGTSG
jgi:putative ATP-binding cassette transporter